MAVVLQSGSDTMVKIAVDMDWTEAPGLAVVVHPAKTFVALG